MQIQAILLQTETCRLSKLMPWSRAIFLPDSIKAALFSAMLPAVLIFKTNFFAKSYCELSYTLAAGDRSAVRPHSTQREISVLSVRLLAAVRVLLQP